MKKIILKYGGMLAALAMVFTTLTVKNFASSDVC